MKKLVGIGFVTAVGLTMVQSAYAGSTGGREFNVVPLEPALVNRADFNGNKGLIFSTEATKTIGASILGSGYRLAGKPQHTSGGLASLPSTTFYLIKGANPPFSLIALIRTRVNDPGQELSLGGPSAYQGVRRLFFQVLPEPGDRSASTLVAALSRPTTNSDRLDAFWKSYRSGLKKDTKVSLMLKIEPINSKTGAPAVYLGLSKKLVKAFVGMGFKDMTPSDSKAASVFDTNSTTAPTLYFWSKSGQVKLSANVSRGNAGQDTVSVVLTASTKATQVEKTRAIDAVFKTLN